MRIPAVLESNSGLVSGEKVFSMTMESESGRCSNRHKEKL